jgi:23S rRNA (cytidine1920-2'-O)/16S rRNA (cytidine1409-2'-O)-methyltransferase
VLLERGAAHVTAIDVGHGQMDAALRADPRVTCLEGVNARDLTLRRVGGAPDFVVCDVSFISLRLAMPPALSLAAPGARAVLLVKPQFEAGRERIGKGGLLRDPDDAPRIAEALSLWLDGLPGWRALGLVDSPITGGDGNREFLLAGVKDRSP